MKKPNPIAKAVKSPQFRTRKVKDKRYNGREVYAAWVDEAAELEEAANKLKKPGDE